jgi:hypothetical protein
MQIADKVEKVRRCGACLSLAARDDGRLGAMHFLKGIFF